MKSYDCMNCDFKTDVWEEAVAHRDHHIYSGEVLKEDSGFIWNSSMGKNKILLNGCNCRVAGNDDGNNTCWEHHDCNDGSCTHAE